MELIEEACRTQFNSSATKVMQKILRYDHNTTQDEDEESMLATMGDKVLQLVLCSLVYQHGSTLNSSRQIPLANFLANNDTVLGKTTDFIQLRKVIQKLNYNVDISSLTDQILHRKVKAVLGVMAFYHSWDNLRDRINDCLSDYVKYYIATAVDGGKSRNGPTRENETKLQLNRRQIQTINKHLLDSEVEKLSQDFRRTSLEKYTREDESKYSTNENRSTDQNLYQPPQRQYDELQNESLKRETINNSSPGNLTCEIPPRNTVTPKEQRVFSAISGSTCTLQQFKQYVAELPDINARNSGKQGDTPLMLLLKKPQLRKDDEIPKIQVLLGLGASWTATNNFGIDANRVSQKHDPAIISELKDTKALDADDRVSFSESPDYYAVAPLMQKVFSGINGDTYTTIQFEDAVMAVPNVDGRNSGKKGDTALMMLLRKEILDPQRDIPKIRILLKYGASWTATNNRGETAQQLAAKHPRKIQEMLELLQNSTDSQSANSENRISPVINNDSTPIRSVTSQRITTRNLNIHGSSSNNLERQKLNRAQLELIDAIKTRKPIPVNEFERLITRIDDVNFCNESDLGDTPLMMILRKREFNSTDIANCQTLMKYGASWNYKNKHGESAEDLANLQDSNVIAKICTK